MDAPRVRQRAFGPDEKMRHVDRAARLGRAARLKARASALRNRGKPSTVSLRNLPSANREHHVEVVATDAPQHFRIPVLDLLGFPCRDAANFAHQYLVDLGA